MNLYPNNDALDGSIQNSAITRPVTLGIAVTSSADIATIFEIGARYGL